MVQWFDTWRWSSGFKKTKQKAFVLKTVFIHDNFICEGVGEDSGNGA